jgi:NitT/TauT family transport system permease protein
MDFDTTLIFVALVTVMVVVLTLSGALGAMQRRLLRWQAEPPQGSSGPARAA